MLNPDYPTKLVDDDFGGQCLVSIGFIPAGAKVWWREDGVDETITLRSYRRLSEMARQALWDIYSYPVFHANGRFRGMELNRDNAKFMNHAEDPNTYEVDNNTIMVTRDIHPGEPITCHYGDFWAPELQTWGEYQAENPFVLTKVKRTWRTDAMEPVAKAA